MEKFRLVSKFKPTGDQPQAIEKISAGVLAKKAHQTLLGVTGSGKTFTMANVIAEVNKPTLVISHNKTLAAQLYTEFKEFFPHNSVEYFVSYYDYYQPEAYIPQTDTYIEKDSSINDRLDRLRLSSTSSLMSRRDVIIVASVSCIYNLGSPEEYKGLLLFLEKGAEYNRDKLLRRLIEMLYERNDYDFKRSKFRVRGEVVDIYPAYSEKAIRVTFNLDKIKSIEEFNPVTGKKITTLDKIGIYPAKHYIVSQDTLEDAIKAIIREMQDRVEYLTKNGKLLEAQRLEQRTKYDMEMLREVGYCHGIENYSRHLSARPEGSRPFCLLDYFPQDFLVIIDESHVTIPQIRGMYEGDRSRKQTLVDFGFRLPSCLDNRPLKFDEFNSLIRQFVYVSATPSDYEIRLSKGISAEQLVRPTGIIDPAIEIRPTQGQVDDLMLEIKQRAKKNERVLVTTLTKRMSEDLANYLQEEGLRVQYLHSEVETLERVEILRKLRLKEFDCLVGVNLLREGLDLPEVSLVAIFDADKEGFLRSEVSLIQLAGRAARNINGKVIMYADQITGSMKEAMRESSRRREVQIEFNKKYKITPATIKKKIQEGIRGEEEAAKIVIDSTGLGEKEFELQYLISELEYQMESAARNLQFEKAIELRDKLKKLQK
ncbi:MAG: excinuclease ABC subunit UvrB [Candidatus Omnitrophica bacterium]|nr:excinuclease ABC subunit UvrB [Candidatus Omnitrophota bacterium]MDD5352538.1 excinuclease ABC subunit UvrB [Candidatus Omnitrophota bacterium]MDD5550136.1 excinuclease ABC subunit UvrB [Candidatus Omnitrophota bacterium]